MFDAKKLAADLKAEGNMLFQKQKYAAAIDRYTEAHTLCPDWAVLLVNRAICHKLRSPACWSAVQQDTERALSLDPSNMKAHLFLGEALLELQADLPGSVSHLTKALELAREQKSDIKDQIWRSLAKAKYAAWQVESAALAEEQSMLRRRLFGLLSRDHEDALSQAGSCREGLRKEQAAERAALDRLFDRDTARSRSKEVDGAYTCRLTMEVFREPMITTAGLSYEQSALQEHFAKLGNFDPVTRKPTTPEQAIPNLGLRGATEHYLQEHPWAWADVC